jgi:hypothetical protein
MDTKTLMLTVSLALAGLGGQSFAETQRQTSLGSSRYQTKGGSDILKASVISGSSLPQAQQLKGALLTPRTIVTTANNYRQDQSQTVSSLLKSGFKMQFLGPQQLAHEAAELEIRPFENGEKAIVDHRVTKAVANRLDRQSNELLEKAQRLWTKGEITDAQRAQVHQYVSDWKSGAITMMHQASEVLEQVAKERNKVAVNLDE